MILLSILILIVAISLPFNNNISSVFYLRISSIILIYAGALSFNALYVQSIGHGVGIFSGLFHVTSVSQWLDTFLFVIGSLILISWPSITSISVLPATRTAAEYSLIVLFSTLGASLLISSADLISMYLSIELQSFGVYILSSLYRDSESSTSAGLKYFLLGALSSCLILLGSALIYSFTGLTNLESLYSIWSVSDFNNISQGISLGLIVLIVGFLFKIAAAPLHNCTISHIGFMLLALAINTEQSIDSLIFYIVQYSITNLNTFLIILAFGYIIKNGLWSNSTITKNSKLSSLLNTESERDIKLISELKGQFFSNPLLSLSLSICLFSMADYTLIPPLLGFFSKQYVLFSAIQSGYYFMAIIAIVVSVISASYYLKIIRVLHTGGTETAPTGLISVEEGFSSSQIEGHNISESDLTNYHSFMISTLTLSILFFILKPSILLNSTQLLSLSLFNY
uniref:NADH-ubiquinone oxidoreductase chain 2 n=1 Tax=Wolfiporia cocos TaxID=81056 RepID=A0A7G7YDU2_9APHY|nr:NADH dehydrogenase subunit 2 [Wolfiporia cocos]QNH92662.1 NADH dehydrogenase subunit 2 [Wolfiporia cocos]